MEEALPPLTILVHDADGTLGAGFIAWDPDWAAEGRAAVYARDWSRSENPFEVWRDGQTMASLVEKLLQEPSQTGEVFARVRSRGQQQQLFRQLLLDVYDGVCAISGSVISDGLEACHIVGWLEAGHEEAFSLRNGLLLQAWYHRLFDAGVFDIDDLYYVRVPTTLLNDAQPIDRAALSWINGRRVALSPNRALWPSLDLLRRRREELE